MIIQFKDGKLSDFLRDFNKFTTKTILKKMQNELESILEWMPEILQLSTETHSRNKNYLLF